MKNFSDYILISIDLKTDEKFLGWLDEQPKQISDGIYKNNTDAKWASKLYPFTKQRWESLTRSRLDQKNPMLRRSVTRQQPKDVATKDSTKKIWKGSDIAKLKPWEFEKVEAEIDLARQEGRIDMNS